MISRRFLYLIIIIALPTITASAQSSDSISSQNISSIVSPAYLHGMGISKYSRYDPQRSFADAHKKAIERRQWFLMVHCFGFWFPRIQKDPMRS